MCRDVLSEKMLRGPDRSKFTLLFSVIFGYYIPRGGSGLFFRAHTQASWILLFPLKQVEKGILQKTETQMDLQSSLAVCQGPFAPFRLEGGDAAAGCRAGGGHRRSGGGGKVQVDSQFGVSLT